MKIFKKINMYDERNLKWLSIIEFQVWIITTENKPKKIQGSEIF